NPEDLWLSGVDVIEALDPIPEINRTTRFKDVAGACFSQATGRLRVRGYHQRANGVRHLRLKVEVSVPLSLYPDHRLKLEERLITELLARSTRLSQVIRSGEATISIEFVKPGTLGPLDRITQLWVEE